MGVSTRIAVLVIDDSQHDAALAELVLQRSGYQTDLVHVGDEPGMRAQLSERRFDVIVSDVALHDMSGTDALHIAAAMAPATPFIFFSGVAGEASAVEMMRLGATDYVLKQNLALLPTAVGRALAEVHERSERQRVEARLQTVELHSRLAIDAAR